MAVVGRDHWRFSSPAPLFQWGHLNPAAPDSFGVPPSVETPQLPLAICASAQSLQQWKNVSWCSEGTTCVSVCVFCLWLCHWTPLRSPGSILFAHLIQVFIYIGETSFGPSLLQAEQSQLSQLLLISHTLQSLNLLCGPSLDSLQFSSMSISLVLGSPRTRGDGKKHLPLDLLI